ncbi:MAG: transcription antitermination factor NusB, partial [Erysipelotrichaceae bacterium]
MSIRETILEILLQIVLDQKYSNLVLRTELNEQKEEDKRFATNVVYGTLQNQRLIRYQYEPYIQRGVYKDIAILLDMSVYQLLFMDKVPHYAIVNEAVEIAKKRHHGKFASVVNAILRNVIRNGVKEVEGDEWAKLAIETSHPDWIVAMWKKQYGEEVTRKLCVDNNNVPLNMARINRLVANEAQIQALGFHHFGDDCYTYEGAIAPTSAFQEGLVTIQDYASQKVAPFLNPQKGEMVLDACAAPGTKSVHMAQLMENTGKIVALDLHPHRVQLIQNSLNRLHVENVSSMAADATQLHLLYQTPV